MPVCMHVPASKVASPEAGEALSIETVLLALGVAGVAPAFAPIVAVDEDDDLAPADDVDEDDDEDDDIDDEDDDEFDDDIDDEDLDDLDEFDEDDEDDLDDDDDDDDDEDDDDIVAPVVDDDDF